jgi:hypothetical protein
MPIQQTRNIRETITGKFSMPRDVYKVLRKFGSDKVTKLEVVRQPVWNKIQNTLNTVTKEGLKRNIERAGYDDIYHLAVIISTRKGKFRFEKLHRLKLVHDPPPLVEGSEILPIPVTHSVTLEKLIVNTALFMGDKFNPYDSKSNNCQSLIWSVLEANKLGTDESTIFIKQDTSKIFFDDYPYMKTVIKMVTGSLGIISKIKHAYLNRRLNWFIKRVESTETKLNKMIDNHIQSCDYFEFVHNLCNSPDIGSIEFFPNSRSLDKYLHMRSFPTAMRQSQYYLHKAKRNYGKIFTDKDNTDVLVTTDLQAALEGMETAMSILSETSNVVQNLFDENPLDMLPLYYYRYTRVPEILRDGLNLSKDDVAHAIFDDPSIVLKKVKSTSSEALQTVEELAKVSFR